MNTYSLDKMYESYSSEVEKMQKCIDELLQENKKLKEQLLVVQTNEETFRLEMEDITQTLGLDEDTIFDDVKAYARSLKDDWNKLKAINKEYERLNKKNGRGFKITNVQEYNIDELLSYKKYKDKLEKENQELKKQLEEYKRLGFKHLNDKCNKLENQQKEFIEYLEDLIKQNETVVEVSKYGLPKNCSKLLIDFYKEILSKYKEIIGDVKSENK